MNRIPLTKSRSKAKLSKNGRRVKTKTKSAKPAKKHSVARPCALRKTSLKKTKTKRKTSQSKVIYISISTLIVLYQACHLLG